jgi:hypothetical protein
MRLYCTARFFSVCYFNDPLYARLEPPPPLRPFSGEGKLCPWMKEVIGIRHGGGGANLRCPVSTSVHFSLRNEGSSEYIQVCEGRELRGWIG